MEVIQGKLMLIVAWVFALISGQIVSIVFSVIASCLAGIYWVIKIKKELKQKDDVGKN
jgi:hypothetical protein